MKKFFINHRPRTEADWWYVAIMTTVISAILIIYLIKNHGRIPPPDIICFIMAIAAPAYIYVINRDKNKNSQT